MQYDPETAENTSGFYRLPTVLSKIPISRSAWWAGIKAGRYPAGIKIGPRTTAWRQTDIEDLCIQLSGGAK
jgi:predicted DNA-binding transcriptional regulator AlpA